MTIQTMHVFDFDGTICDSSHRYRTQMVEGVEKIDLQYWIDNEHKALEDSLLPLVELYRESLADISIYTVIATARIWCDLSVQFAAREGITPQHVIARRDRQDNRGGAELKIDGIDTLLHKLGLRDIEKIEVFEDNTDYLRDICNAIGAIGHYYPSVQGH